MPSAGATPTEPVGAIIRGSGRSRSSSPGVESNADYDRSRSADRGRGSTTPNPEVFVPLNGNSTSSSSTSKNGKLQPATITERLRQVVGPQCDGLPVLVGLVCARIAQAAPLSSDLLRQELKPQLPGEVKPEDLEEFLAWLEKEHQAPPTRPKDPRLSQAHPGMAFKEGDMVTLCGLEKRPDLNGSSAEVLRSNDPSQPGRVVVKLGSGSQLAIRPENLQQAAASRASSPEEEEKPASETPKPSDPDKGSVFWAAFAKLKAKAEAEARGELLPEKKRFREKENLDQRGGIGSAQPAGQARRELVMGTPPTAQAKEVEEESAKIEPITFVAAEGRHEPPSRKVTVINPRRPKRPLEESDDDEDVGIPGVVKPRGPGFGSKDIFNVSGPPCVSAQKVAKTTPEPVCQMPAAPPRGLAKTAGSPVPNKTFASPVRRPNMPLQNMTLVVSDDAKEADKAQRELAEKRKAMEEGKRQMLEKLTKQMQLCLARLQNADLDDKAKERYQDMITTLKAQMSKIGHV